MERKLMSELLKWKDKSNRKPLLLEGARQVGKAEQIIEITHNTFTHNNLTSALVGWVESLKVEMFLVTNTPTEQIFSVENLLKD